MKDLKNEEIIEKNKNINLSKLYPTPNFYFPRRLVFVLLGFIGISICYITRVTLSVSIIKMQHKYDWSNTFKGILLSSFSLGYCITQVPAQWLCNKYGGKRVLLVGLTVSILTLFLVPIAAENKISIIIIRILCGLFQGVCFSTISWLIGRWVPLSQRSSSASFIWSGVYGGTVIGDFITPVLLTYVSWENSFYIIGGICLIWSLIWLSIITDYPKDIHLIGIHKNELLFINHGKDELNNNNNSKVELIEINNNKPIDNIIEDLNTSSSSIASSSSIDSIQQDEQQQPQEKKEKETFKIVIKKFLKSKTFLSLMYLNITCNFGYFLLLNWAPTFISKQLGNSDGFKFAFFNSLPFIIALLNATISGLISDKLLSKGFKKLYVRKFFGCLVYGIPSIFYFLLAFLPVGYIGKIILLTIIVCSNGFVPVSTQILTLDITSFENASIAMGITNMCSGVTAVLGPLLGGVLITAFHDSWSPIFVISGCLYVIGLFVWVIFIKVDVIV